MKCNKYFIFFLFFYLFFFLNLNCNISGLVKKEINKESILEGNKYFNGESSFKNGGNSCNNCHGLNLNNFHSSGSFAVNLTEVYSRLGQEGLEAVLRNPPFPAMKSTYENKNLTTNEINCLISYFNEINKNKNNYIEINYSARIFSLSFIGYILLMAGYFFILLKDKDKVSNI